MIFGVRLVSQTPEAIRAKFTDSLKTVTIRGKVRLNWYAKGSLEMSGYVIEGEREEFEKYKGKRIKVTGKLLIVKGVESLPKIYDLHGIEIPKQGRYGESRHILSPKIKVIWLW